MELLRRLSYCISGRRRWSRKPLSACSRPQTPTVTGVREGVLILALGKSLGLTKSTNGYRELSTESGLGWRFAGRAQDPGSGWHAGLLADRVRPSNGADVGRASPSPTLPSQKPPLSLLTRFGKAFMLVFAKVPCRAACEFCAISCASLFLLAAAAVLGLRMHDA
jgi:hypothetical protein